METRQARFNKVDMLDPELKKVLCAALRSDDIAYGDGIETIDLWDSMMHMEIMVALEKNYSIRIEPREIIELTSVRAVQDYLRSKGVL